MFVKDVMSADVKTVDPNLPLTEAARLMKTMDVGALPVAEDGIAVGIITDRDIAVRAVADGCDPSTTPVWAVMTPDPIQIDREASLDDAITLMMDRKIGRVLVSDETGRLVGIVSASDAAIYSPSAWEVSALMTQIARRDRSKIHEHTNAIPA